MHVSCVVRPAAFGKPVPPPLPNAPALPDSCPGGAGALGGGRTRERARVQRRGRRSSLWRGGQE
eukprot:scaffold131341_cov31-Tisochrysis_lutea.AAC.1